MRQCSSTPGEAALGFQLQRVIDGRTDPTVDGNAVRILRICDKGSDAATLCQSSEIQGYGVGIIGSELEMRSLAACIAGLEHKSSNLFSDVQVPLLEIGHGVVVGKHIDGQGIASRFVCGCIRNPVQGCEPVDLIDGVVPPRSASAKIGSESMNPKAPLDMVPTENLPYPPRTTARTRDYMRTRSAGLN